jgi:hypothetical protein
MSECSARPGFVAFDGVVIGDKSRFNALLVDRAFTKLPLLRQVTSIDN